MARNAITIDASPEDVFDALLEPESYAYWVVGSKEIRGVDADWPAVGSRFQHTQGAGPVEIRDYTEVEQCDPPRRLVLLARVRPATDARVQLNVRPSEGGGTEVEMIEEAIGAVAGSLPEFLTDPAITARNAESLRRLKQIVEEHPR
jgi:uncharacterized protein YndB with AHSA1/START domain